MIFGFENLNCTIPIPIPQISELVKRGEYNDLELDRIITLPKRAWRATSWFNLELIKNSLFSLLTVGDVVVTASLKNFSTSTDGILYTIEAFFERGARLISIEEDFDSDLLDRETIAIIAHIADENRLSKEFFKKQRIATAMREGRYANQVKLSDFPDFKSLYTAYEQRSITKTEIAKRLKISRPTLNKLFEQYQQENDLAKEGENADENSNHVNK